jgi:outer membrane protein assembly factor BamB
MFSRFMFPALLGLTLLAASQVFADNWPCYRGPSSDGICAETGLNKDWAAKTPPVLWSVPMYDGGYSAPIIVDGVVYILDHRANIDIMRALKADTGEKIWETNYPDGGADAREGQARSTPAYDNGKVYTWSKGGKATCYNAADGKVIWQRYLKNELKGQFPDFGYSSSPLIDGKQVIFVPGGNNNTSVVALDKDTGTNIWAAGNYGNPGYGTPMIYNFDGKKQYVIFVGNAVVSVDPATGAENWKYQWVTGESCNGLGLAPVGGDAFVGTSGYGHGTEMVQVKDNTPKQMWHSRQTIGGDAFGSKTTSPIVVKDLLFVIGENARLACIDVKTGKKFWDQAGWSAGNGSPGMTYADGVLLIMQLGTSEVVMVDPTANGYHELGRITTLPKSVAYIAPAIANKKLYVRSGKFLSCVDLDPDAKAPVLVGTGAGAGPTVVPNVMKAPDLVVTNVTLTPAAPKAGDTVTFTCTVKNQGDSATFAGMIIGVAFTVDAETAVTWSDTETNALAPGASVTLTANGGTAGGAWTATAGQHTVTAFVDNIDRMGELKEDNNKLGKTFTVTAL